MSLMSFPRTEVVYEVDNKSDPAKIILTFRGNSSSPLAHSIDPPQPSCALKSRNRRQAKPVNNARKMDYKEPPEIVNYRKRMEMLKKGKEEFLDKGILKAMYGAVEQKVRCACMSTDHLLAQKQSRLRELLLAEEVAYASEYVAMCQQANASREEDLRKKAFELQTKFERERQAYVDQKLLEHVVDECDAARPVLTKKHLLEVKKDQLWQIKEKFAMEEAKREEEKMYHDLMMKNMMALKENEEEIAKLNKIRQKDVQKSFQEQMKWKQEKDEKERQLKEFERLQLEEELRKIKEEKEKEKIDNMRKKQERIDEFKEALAKEKEFKDKRKQEEADIDRMFAKLMKIEEEKEKSKQSSEKERLKREMDVFLESSKELKRQREEEEKKVNEMLEELNEKKRQQKDAERRKVKEAKQELFQSILREREEQIKAKREREKREEEQRETEIRLLTLQLEQQNKIREDFERRCVLQREEYRLQLLQQIQDAEEAKRKKKQDEDEFVRLQKEKEDKEIEKIKNILSRLPINESVHPMKIIAQEQKPSFMCPYPCPR